MSTLGTLKKRANQLAPDFIKQAAAPLIRRQLTGNRAFREQYEFLTRAKGMSSDERATWQLDRLRRVLIDAYHHVPYYREVFDGAGLDPSGLRDFSELSVIPLLTKKVLKERFDDLQSPDVDDYYLATTGGSTGEPTKVNLDTRSIYLERAFVYAFWAEQGYDWRASRVATLRGVKFGGKLHRPDPLYNAVLLNPFLLNEGNVSEYVSTIDSFGADFIHGYPSAIQNLCLLMKRTGVLPKRRIRCVFFVSENVEQRHVDLVRDVLGCPARAFYGHSERAVFAEQHGDVVSYDFNPFYGYTEIVPHGDGNIVCTGFLSRRMPLIRYAVDDTATPSEPCVSISGHHDDTVLYGRSGERISQTAVNFHDGTFDGVEAYQLVQSEVGRAECRVRSSSSLSDSDIGAIASALDGKTEGRIAWQVTQNKPFELTQRGKAKTIVQKIGWGGGVIRGHREGDYLVGRNGERLTLSALNFHGSTFDGIGGVQGYQFVQTAPGSAVCRLRCDRILGRGEVRQIADRLARGTGSSVAWDVTQDEPFALSPRGKAKAVCRLFQEES